MIGFESNGDDLMTQPLPTGPTKSVGRLRATVEKQRKPRTSKPKMEVQIIPNTPAPRTLSRLLGTTPTQQWATFGVGFMASLSAGLNGYANAQHATVPWAGWLLGLSVPIIVLVLAKVAGLKHRAGQHAVAGFAGVSGVALLLLSVWHCALSIALLTGGDMLLTVPMAIAIDCGLVACEVAIITE